jgi:hypothetical protein
VDSGGTLESSNVNAINSVMTLIDSRAEGRGMNRRVDIVILGRGMPALPVASSEPRFPLPSPPAEPKPHS